jgi:hypothetical protein
MSEVTILTEDEGDALYLAARIQLQRMGKHDPRRAVLIAAIKKFAKAEHIYIGEKTWQ